MAFPVMPLKLSEVEAALKVNPEYKLLNAEEKEWVYWTNYSRLQPRAFWDSVVSPILKTYPNLVSGYSNSLKQDLYKGASLPILYPNKQLLNLAGSHAADLAKKHSSPSHTSTNGNSFQKRMLEAGIIRCAAENISFGPDNPVFGLVLLYIDDGLPDLGHRKTLLTPGYTQMGIGRVSYPNNMWLVVQDFACDQTP